MGNCCAAKTPGVSSKNGGPPIPSRLEKGKAKTTIELEPEDQLREDEK